MRLWSIHPKYLDAKGLVALWREGLLAQKVLAGDTSGYRNHPQLNRFKTTLDPVGAIASYLTAVADEADTRGYNFNRSKILATDDRCRIKVTQGQIKYEFQHLLTKLNTRDPERYTRVAPITDCDVHPMFDVVIGDIENWENSMRVNE